MISHNEYDAHDNIYLHTFAPIVVDFTEWVLKEAVKAGHQRLYFLARDGFLFYETAQILVERKKIPIDLRYLKVSRYSIRSAEYSLIGDKALDLICTGGIDVSFRKLMKRGMLKDEETQLVADEIDFTESFDAPLNYRKVRELKNALTDSRRFKGYVEKYSESRLENVVGYLKQQGLMDDVDYAFVDSGWIGTLHRSLTNITGKAVHGYYFGLYEYPEDIDEKLYHWYYFGPKGMIRRKVLFSNCLFETILSEPDGMTLSYSNDGEEYCAITGESNPNRERIARRRDIQCQYTNEYANEYPNTDCTDYGISKQKAKKLHTDEKLLSLLMGFPIPCEVQILGNDLFCDDVLESQMCPVATDLSEEDIQNLKFLNKLKILAGIKKADIHESGWIEGSIVKNDAKVNGNIRSAHFYKYILYLRKSFR